MKEKDLEDILQRYPDMIEDGLRVEGRQVAVGQCRIDLVFRDRFGQMLITELKSGAILREHIGQLFEYQGGLLIPDDPNVRVMLIGNRVPPNMRRSLEHHGFEWREFTIAFLIAELRMRNDAELLARFEEHTLSAAPTAVHADPNPRASRTARVDSEQSLGVPSAAPTTGTDGTLTNREKLHRLFGAANLGLTLEARQIVDLVLTAFPGTNGSSVLPSDFCYNIVNAGIAFKDHLFEKQEGRKYLVLGLNYPYVGPITWKGKQVGEWLPGRVDPIFTESVTKGRTPRRAGQA